jgi:hypothetical protein
VRNSRFDLAPWEIEVIEDLDDLYCQIHNEAARDKMNAEKRKT